MSDAREQLFGAAERVLHRDGPAALTSRAVTTEAGCAKGVLHRHFADFDTFLVDLVLERIARVDGQGQALAARAGTATVAENLTCALTILFESAARDILGLLTSRHELLTRLRQTTPRGLPVLTDATAMVVSYLTLERDLGRVAADADIDALAPMLIGTGHLLFAGRHDDPPEPDAVRRLVDDVVSGVLR
jgi:AcrR family transcriptional regulator